MTIDAAGLDLLFKEARTHNKWHDKPVADETLHELYDILKFGPTSANSSPARFVFIRTKEGKQKLARALSGGEHGKNHDRSGHCDRSLRSEILRKVARTISPQSGCYLLVHQQ